MHFTETHEIVRINAPHRAPPIQIMMNNLIWLLYFAALCLI